MTLCSLRTRLLPSRRVRVSDGTTSCVPLVLRCVISVNVIVVTRWAKLAVLAACVKASIAPGPPVSETTVEVTARQLVGTRFVSIAIRLAPFVPTVRWTCLKHVSGLRPFDVC